MIISGSDLIYKVKSVNSSVNKWKVGAIQGVGGHPIAEWREPKEGAETQKWKLRGTVRNYKK